MKIIKKHYPVLILAAAAFIIALPFLITLLNAYKTTPQFYSLRQVLFPTELSNENFSHRIFISDYRLTQERLFFNSWFFALLTAFIEVVVSAGAAYVLAVVNNKVIGFLNRVIDFSLIFSGGYFIGMKASVVIGLGFYDSVPGMILPFTATAFGVILIRRFMKKIDTNILDAARIEGAGHYTLYFRICLPSAKPALTAAAVISLITAMKRTTTPLYFSSGLKTAADILSQKQADFGFPAALVLMITVPLAVVFLVFKKSIINTLSDIELTDKQ